MEPAIGPINQFVSHRSHYDAAISVSDRGQGKGPTASHAFCGLGRFQWADQVDANDYSMDQGGIQQDCNSGIIQRARERATMAGRLGPNAAGGGGRKEKASEAVEMAGRVGSNLMEMSCLSEFPALGATAGAALASAPSAH